MLNAHIIGWGKYLPERFVTNEDLAKCLPIDAERVAVRTGIKGRHFAAPHQATSDLAALAALSALTRANLSPRELDLIIIATNTPDHLFPATGCLVQNAIGAPQAAAFDLVAGCSGFLYALATGAQFIRGGAYRNVLIVAAEVLSRFIDWNDRGTRAYFGDGAGAVVLSALDEPGGMLAFDLQADGSNSQTMRLPAGGSRNPLTQQALDQGLHYGRMDGGAAYRFGLRAMSRVAQNVLSRAGLTIDEIDLFIPHQSNRRLIEQVAETLNVGNGKVAVNLEEYANISNAAIPVTLSDMIERGRIKPRSKILMTAFGGGMTYAGVIWQWIG